MDRNEAIDILRVIAPPRTSKKAFYDFMEARDMAIAALEGKDTNVHTNSALDHIHNVVRDDAYRRGCEQGKADANCPEIPDSCNAETVEAIPTAWIEAEIKKLRDLDNGFASLSAGQIEAMLRKWREEQK